MYVDRLQVPTTPASEPSRGRSTISAYCTASMAPAAKQTHICTDRTHNFIHAHRHRHRYTHTATHGNKENVRKKNIYQKTFPATKKKKNVHIDNSSE